MAGKEPKAWITVNGVHVPIFEGQSKEEAVKAHLAKRVRNDDSGKERQIAQSKQEAEKKTADEPVQLKDNTDYDQFIRDNIKVLRTSHKSMDEIKQDWYELRHNAEIKNLKEEDIETSITNITDHVRASALTGWFRSANSDYKPEIASSVLGNPGTLNSALNIAYNNYRWQFERYSELYGKWIPHDGVDQSKKLSFKDWLITPQTMYRGTHGQKTVASDIFSSYTPDKSMASRFGTEIDTIQIRPIDTYGSYQTTGEQEFLVPARWLSKRQK